jgi:lysophospholipase L1-like esterase
MRPWLYAGSRFLGGGHVAYLLRDEFTTAAEAPVTSPRTGEPGPGTFTLVQTDGQFSIANGKIVFPAQTTPTFGDLSAWGAAQTRAVGLGCAWQINVSTRGFVQAGWDSNTAGAINDAVYPQNTGAISINQNAATVALLGGNNPYAADTDYVLATVLRSTGAWYYMRGGAYGSWCRLWTSNVGNGATVYPALGNYAAVGSSDYGRAFQLLAPFDSDTGPATAAISGTVSEAATFTHAVDSLLYLDAVTLPSAGSIRVAFRRDDDDNCWVLDINSAGNLSLILRTGGVDAAPLITSAGAVTNGVRVGIGWDGPNLRAWVTATNKGNSDLAKQLQGRTSGKVLSLGTGGAITGLNTWSCYPGGAERAALNRFVPRPGTYAVFFGDSITAGTGASDAAHRYANIAATAQGWTLVNSGISGTTLQNTVQTATATSGLATDNNGRDTCANRVVRHAPDRVVILYGLNDLRLNDVAYSDANYQTDLGEVVDLIVAGGTPASSIVIGSPPYCTNYAGHAAPSNAGSAEKHAAYVAAAAAVATAKGTRYADVYAAMVAGGGNSLLSADNVHPNDAGHAVIATAIQAAL